LAAKNCKIPARRSALTSISLFMKTRVIISTLIFLTLASCNNSQTQDKEKQETPKALEDKSLSYEIVSKRGYDDLVESLYIELVDKTPELKQLEIKIKNLRESKGDSTKLFDAYNGKNQVYFNSANEHIEQIKDSIMRDKMKTLISLSLTKYNLKILQHSNLLKAIDARNLTLNDLHTILKITRTLPLIEKYQKNNLPTLKSIDGFSKRLDEALKYADTLTKK
jgi:hypothetical protein